MRSYKDAAEALIYKALPLCRECEDIATRIVVPELSSTRHKRVHYLCDGCRTESRREANITELDYADHVRAFKVERDRLR